MPRTVAGVDPAPPDRFGDSLPRTVAGVDTNVVAYNFSKGLGAGAGFEIGRAGSHAAFKSVQTLSSVPMKILKKAL